MIRAIGFDLDNTLFDHTEAAATAMRTLVREMRWTYNGSEPIGLEWHRIETIYFSQYASGVMTLVEHRRARMREFLKSTDVNSDEVELDSLWNNYVQHYSASWIAYSDVLATLRDLKGAGYKMAVLTNGQQAQQEAKLEAIGLSDVFEACLAIGTVEALKPDPRAFAQLCRVLDCQPHEVLFVGDDLDVDVRASVSAGLNGVWLNREGLATPPDISTQVRSLDSLKDLLAK